VTTATMDFEAARRTMVERDLAPRGITDERVLRAMAETPREAFVPPGLEEFAYEDAPLPIEEDQTISQPYIVALMIQALALRGGERVLDIGTGSGYAAAVLAHIAGEVFTIERLAGLADIARRRFVELGYANIDCRWGDGTLGWPEHAPYDAIVVAAGGPKVPEALLEQLAVGGRLVIPVGESLRAQVLVRIVRTGPDRFEAEELEAVRFVPLVGAAGWAERNGKRAFEARSAAEAAAEAGARVEPLTAAPRAGTETLVRLIRETAEPIADPDTDDLGALYERLEDARVVLLGEATHGTSEFYRMRARITRDLIRDHGFRLVAVEADWPDAARIDRYVRGRPMPEQREPAFTRFPTWMWRNTDVRELVDWLHAHNADRPAEDRAAFHGLDLYSLFRSIDAVLAYLDEVDPEAASVARARYGCLTPWERDPAVYGRAAITGAYRVCEAEVVQILRDLLDRRLEYIAADGEEFLDAVQNARLVANAERYYRIMYRGSAESWNLRDGHMFDTLQLLLATRGPDAKAIVWAHNSHCGNAAATEMGVRGEHNIGQLAREAFGGDARLVGFGTDTGTVAAASEWGAHMEVKTVRPSHPESYERVFHDTDLEACLLHLREPVRPEVRGELEPTRLERAIAVIYRPETELQSHYFQACLPHQFDEYVWFDRTRAVQPLAGPELAGVPDTYPFGL